MEEIIIGMLAHVDAGKTTLTESILYEAGALSELGRVDHGTAFLDTDALEKSRGITIYSKEARFSQGGKAFTLLDTPGHVDFSPEMERSLSVLDYGILVISASDGVQSHTETLWRLLKQHNIPCFLFINKMDLPDLQVEDLMEELKSKFDYRCTNFSVDQGDSGFLEQVALCDEQLLSLYMDQQTLQQEEIRQGIAEQMIFPCYFGSALKLEGVGALLEGIRTYTQGTAQNNGKIGGKIFKITRDSQGNRLTHLKITSGALAVRDVLDMEGELEKVTEIRLYSGEKYEITPSVGTGTICAVMGLHHSEAGKSFGVEPALAPPVLAPVLTYRLHLPPGVDVNMALPQLKQLQEEDPALKIHWEQGEIHLQLMGDVQLEVLSWVISQRFGYQVRFGERNIVYRESLAEGQKIEGIGHYEPLRHYAEVQVHLEPLARGAGMEYVSTCPSSVLEPQYQHLILSQLREGHFVGKLTGSPLIDMKITLTAGKSHQKHTVGGDFREATQRAVGQGLMQGKMILLEPWSKLRLQLPSAQVGRAMSDFQRMGGSCEISQVLGEESILTAQAALSQLGNYASTLASYSGGRGSCQQSFLGYLPCVDSLSVIAQKKYQPNFPCDSVFCKQGAGFVVPWEEVPQHAHSLSSLPKEVVEEPVQVVRQRCRAYASTLAEDKDLMEIFQRTYGKLSEDSLVKFQKKAQAPSAVTVKPQRKREKFLLVDGYNIIFAWDSLAELGRDSLDSARERLLQVLCNYQGFTKTEVIVVFDAYKVKGGVGAVEPYHNITQVFTKEAETADMYIEKASRSLALEYDLRVATSDGLEQLIIFSQGAQRLSARGLWEEIQQMERAIAAFLQ